MKVGYKSTSIEGKCLKNTYEVGKEYIVDKKEVIREISTLGASPVEDKSLRVHSEEVIHYCDNFSDCQNWAKPKYHTRFFEIQVLGRFKNELTKSGTTHIKILKELSESDIKSLKEKALENAVDTILGLKKLRKLQKAFPNLIVGGSISLFLQGVKLGRLTARDRDPSDFDLISPYWINLEDVGAELLDSKNSGNSFNETYTYEGIKLDLAISNTSKFSIVEHNGHKYKVNSIFEILGHKISYATQKNGHKHRKDIMEIIGIKTENK
ncbi:hypothetical protein Phi4:1_gp159 [Cellulophaga phage phi4:1]|uniref:DUF7666 domain-containing protein n=5 Tax=Lightbulbvirus TaxID=1918522 RepID=A0A0S2MWT8_9CAUD|nr:hypothetical protein Phi4:1_gp159 [Cellulophaga phage phi4:1]YP_008241658.1 hypothetical protein Phi17:2_gp163 [Cellulophaga phage phi17:2]ALO80168.1 hypothetical protein Phi4113_159 [Cellulophaga phage phi4:1_13]ALO80365.1 hypothetical protein Phi4118_159 [Cellulophaga phage phi4:1_18]ALO80566.1 hypothetical protein Phi17218_163 [Cellulophaga phage phi17:2_18]AGO47696.1 hypothetical protein Phi17:2_gp163 [Cellulophaga phage phi17:2]AGO49572.1 hypothetical protein Phi4:1_gp159 [Cellulophag